MALTCGNFYNRLQERFFWYLGRRPEIGDSSANGRYGEWLGSKFLISNGFVIKSKNWRSPNDRRLEIDLVCIKQGVLVFIEIKARSELALVSGFHSIDIRKRKALLRAFKSYFSHVKPTFANYRFDVIEIDLPANRHEEPRIFHHENVAIFH